MNLPFAEYRFIFRANEQIHIPKFSGSMWRGAFGHALKKLSCCGEAPHTQLCRYSFLFEPQQKHYAQQMPFVQSPPLPYVFHTTKQVASSYDKDDLFDIGLILVGKANQEITLVIEAMQQAAAIGLGKGKGRAVLHEVIQYQQGVAHLVYGDGIHFKPPSLIDILPKITGQMLRVKIITPLGFNQMEELDVSYFLMNLVRRISLLQHCYAPEHVGNYDFSLLKQAVTQIDSRKDVYMVAWERYSERQKRSHPMRGWMGSFLLSGKGLNDLLPFLYLGQWLHSGKMANMGMGRYELQFMEWL